MGTPNIKDLMTLIQAGINPATGLPIRMSDGGNCDLKPNIKRFLRIIDEQDAVNRGTWHNLPCNITSQELERMLYYKGQLAFFYMKETNEFYFMPYALDGTIDFYGRFNTVHPVPMANGTTESDKKRYNDQLAVLSQMKLKCIYGVVLDEDIDEKMMTESCVLLHDYTKQLSQTIIPRCDLNDSIIDVMAECIPLMRTQLLASTGVEGVRVQDADQAQAVSQASIGVKQSALKGDIFVPVVGTIDFQEISGGNAGKSEEFMVAMQSLDNLRLSSYGLDNGGLFEKKAHVLNAEEQVNQTNVGLVMQDAVSIRQNFCNVVNSIWDLGIWYEPSENETMADMNGDGLLYDRNEVGENGGIETNANNDNL